MTAAHRFWKVAGSLLAGLTLTSLAWSAIDHLASRTETRTERFDANEIDTVIVQLDHGVVTVAGEEGSDIFAKASLRVGIFDPTLTIRRSGRSLVVRGRCGTFSDNCVGSIDLTVPPEIDLRITSSDGDLEARRITGGVDLNTDNGAITTTDVSGKLTMRSENGDLLGDMLGGSTVTARSDNGSVRLDFSDTPNRVTATSDNGNIDVRLPRSADTTGTDFAVTASSDNGDVATPIRTNPASPRAIQASSDNGDVTVAYQP